MLERSGELTSRDSSDRRSRSVQLHPQAKSQGKDRIVHRAQYHHESGLLENNAHTSQLNASIRRQMGLKSNPIMPTGAVRAPDSRNRSLSVRVERTSKSPRKDIEYNKWYIDPKLRYLQREENPKNNIRAYANQQFVYRNLHNQHFWDWKHPFDKVQEQSSELKSKPISTQAEELSKNKGNLRILEEFRRKLEDNRMRLPLIVKEVLETAPL